MTTTAKAAEAHFRAVAPHYMRLFMEDFDASELDAAAVFGNAGYESLGFTKLQEMKPVVKGSRGGWGWFQWTASRRVAFEAYCKRNDLDPASDEANYKFLFVELIGSEKGAIAKLKAADTLESKVKAFELAFERAGVKAYDKRTAWARIALEALRDAPEPKAPIPDLPAPEQAEQHPVEEYEEEIAPAGRKLPSWWRFAIIIVLAVLAFVASWAGNADEVAEAQQFGLLGGSDNVWTDIGMQIALSFARPLVDAAVIAIVGAVGLYWQKWFKVSFDAKSREGLQEALTRGALAALDAFGPRASKAKLADATADYVQRFNGGTVEAFGLKRSDLKRLAAPHVLLARQTAGR
jgi:hypothetical protein